MPLQSSQFFSFLTNLIVQRISVLAALQTALTASLLPRPLLKEPLLALAAAVAALVLAVAPEPNGGPFLLLGAGGGAPTDATIQLGHVDRAAIGHHAAVRFFGSIQLKTKTNIRFYSSSLCIKQ